MPANWKSRGTVLTRIGRHHFAFFRGYLDGIDIKQLSARYIETNSMLANGADLRKAHSLLAWIKEQLTLIARRSGNAAGIRLIRMAPERLAVGAPPHVPDLEEFCDERDPYRMFSEHELLQLFEEEYGHLLTSKSDRRLNRNKRLRERQMVVLATLEALVDGDPRLEDRIDGWLDPAIAKRLIDAGITTLDELVIRIETYGFRWYTKVPRIGMKAAGYIREWLILPETAHSLGVTLSPRSVLARKHIIPATLPALPCHTGIVPLERFESPEALNGASGANRGKQSTLNARTDMEAIGAWIIHRGVGNNTSRAYRREAERFLLWSVLEAGKALSSLTVNDCVSYRDFLSRIGRESEAQWAEQFRIPQSDWIGRRGIDRFSSRWRPFEGALSGASQQTALVILAGMMQWLCNSGYLTNNPFKAMPQRARPKERGDVSRCLTSGEWSLLEDKLASKVKDHPYFRLRFILALARTTGCSMATLASMKRGDVSPSTFGEKLDAQWMMVVVERGAKVRSIALGQAILSTMDDYFQQRGYRSFLDAPAGAPLIANYSAPLAVIGRLPETSKAGAMTASELPLSPARIYKILKTFFGEVATATELIDPDMAARYRAMSPHWLKRTTTVQNDPAIKLD